MDIPNARGEEPRVRMPCERHHVVTVAAIDAAERDYGQPQLLDFGYGLRAEVTLVIGQSRASNPPKVVGCRFSRLPKMRSQHWLHPAPLLEMPSPLGRKEALRFPREHR